MDKQLSFLAAFDDLMRNAKVLHVGVEPGMVFNKINCKYMHQMMGLFYNIHVHVPSKLPVLCFKRSRKFMVDLVITCTFQSKFSTILIFWR